MQIIRIKIHIQKFFQNFLQRSEAKVKERNCNFISQILQFYRNY